MHVPSAPSNHVRAKRGRITGWTPEAVRRHTQFLKSVLWEHLTGYGYAVTLTMGECPDSSDQFHAARRAFLMRVERAGASRVHWVVEWTRRRVPHLHMCLYFERPLDARARAELVRDWLEIAQRWTVGARGQDVKEISGPLGWLQYLSKHAARGVSHYQRSGKPDGWETTGRLWGRWGEWPTEEPSAFTVPAEGWYRYRRQVRAWRIADARSALLRAQEHLSRCRSPEAVRKARSDERAARRRLVSARQCLQTRDRRLGAVRGMAEWTPREVTEALLDLLSGDGYGVVQVG